MAPTAGLERRATSNGSGITTTTLAIIVSFVALLVALILALLIVTIINRLRRRSRNNTTAPTPQAMMGHKLNMSETSMDPLLTPPRWDISTDTFPKPELPYPDTPPFLLPLPRFLPDPIEFDPIHNEQSWSSYKSPSHLRLPPLIIPDHTTSHTDKPSQPVRQQAVVEQQVVVLKQAEVEDEELSPVPSSSSGRSSPSLYSQYTHSHAEGRRYSPDTSPVPDYASFPFPPALPSTLPYAYGNPVPNFEEPSGGHLARGETRIVGDLLKARAVRNPQGLIRTGSQVSHIERNGSIKSVNGNQPFPSRYRKKQRTRRVSIITEGLEDRSRPSSRDDTSIQPPIPAWNPPTIPPPLPSTTYLSHGVHSAQQLQLPSIAPLRFDPRRTTAAA